MGRFRSYAATPDRSGKTFISAERPRRQTIRTRRSMVNRDKVGIADALNVGVHFGHLRPCTGRQSPLVEGEDDFDGYVSLHFIRFSVGVAKVSKHVAAAAHHFPVVVRMREHRNLENPRARAHPPSPFLDTLRAALLYAARLAPIARTGRSSSAG